MATADPKAVRLPQLGRNKLHRSALGGMDKSILALVAFAAIALSGALLLAALILSSAASVGGLSFISPARIAGIGIRNGSIVRNYQRKRPRRGARRGRFGIVPAGAKARLNKSADRALFRPRRLTVQPAENKFTRCRLSRLAKPARCSASN